MGGGSEPRRAKGSRLRHSGYAVTLIDGDPSCELRRTAATRIATGIATTMGTRMGTRMGKGMGTTRWILFDLGNVLVTQQQMGFSNAAELFGVAEITVVKFFADAGIGEALTRGSMQPEELASLVERRFGGTVTRDLLVEWFGPEIAVPVPGVVELVTRLSRRYSLAILSNTFFGHWDYFAATEFAAMFEVTLPSHLTGFVKPDHQAYENAMQCMGAAPSEVVFVDDLVENVLGARAVGIRSFESHSVEETERGLEDCGVTW